MNSLTIIFSLGLVCLLSTNAAATETAISWDGLIYPGNAGDDNDTTYTLAPYVSEEGFTCPTGNFSPHATYPNNFCTHDSTGYNIASWAILKAVRDDSCRVSVYGCNEDDGCSGSYCGGISASIMIFVASDDTLDENTTWTYLGQISIASDTCDESSEFQFLFESQDDYFVVARGAQGNAYPDPRIQEIDVSSGSAGCI